MNNLAQRVVVAAVGIPLLLGAATYGSWPLMIVAGLLQSAALLEWRRLYRVGGSELPAGGLFLATAALDFAIWTSARNAAMVVGLLTLAAILLGELFRRERKPLHRLGGTALYLLYAALPFALWVPMSRADIAERFEPAGALIILFAATWICDSGAYFIGRWRGRIRLFPTASPNKTVEGFLGGLLFSCMIVPLGAALGLIAPSVWDYFAVPLIAGGFGQAGDLLESLMKREAGIKDTATVLPGHGGILDRFDSMLISTLLLFAYLLLTS